MDKMKTQKYTRKPTRNYVQENEKKLKKTKLTLNYFWSKFNFSKAVQEDWLHGFE